MSKKSVSSTAQSLNTDLVSVDPTEGSGDSVNVQSPGGGVEFCAGVPLSALKVAQSAYVAEVSLSQVCCMLLFIHL